MRAPLIKITSPLRFIRDIPNRIPRINKMVNLFETLKFSNPLNWLKCCKIVY